MTSRGLRLSNKLVLCASLYLLAGFNVFTCRSQKVERKLDVRAHYLCCNIHFILTPLLEHKLMVHGEVRGESEENLSFKEMCESPGRQRNFMSWGLFLTFLLILKQMK